jgi:hypothetical protein
MGKRPTQLTTTHTRNTKVLPKLLLLTSRAAAHRRRMLASFCQPLGFTRVKSTMDVAFISRVAVDEGVYILYNNTYSVLPCVSEFRGSRSPDPEQRSGNPAGFCTFWYFLSPFGCRCLLPVPCIKTTALLRQIWPRSRAVSPLIGGLPVFGSAPVRNVTWRAR